MQPFLKDSAYLRCLVYFGTKCNIYFRENRYKSSWLIIFLAVKDAIKSLCSLKQMKSHLRCLLQNMFSNLISDIMVKMLQLSETCKSSLLSKGPTINFGILAKCPTSVSPCTVICTLSLFSPITCITIFNHLRDDRLAPGVWLNCMCWKCQVMTYSILESFPYQHNNIPNPQLHLRREHLIFAAKQYHMSTSYILDCCIHVKVWNFAKNKLHIELISLLLLFA